MPESDSTPPVFQHLPPRAPRLPVVASIPHTGTHLSAELSRRLASDAMREQPMTDWHLHHLYSFLPDLGVEVIHATWSRFQVDLNRPPDSRPLYPGRFETGLVPRQTFQGETVFAEPPTPEEEQEWCRTYHAPYHARLLQMIQEAVERHGRVVLLDLHSVASVANLLHGALEHEIYLGNRDGGSCDPWLMEAAVRCFQAEDFLVSCNDPYKGGYITRHHGRPPAVQALQIEMAQRAYMPEDDPSGAREDARFAAATGRLERVLRALLTSVQEIPGTTPRTRPLPRP